MLIAELCTDVGVAFCASVELHFKNQVSDFRKTNFFELPMLEFNSDSIISI